MEKEELLKTISCGQKFGDLLVEVVEPLINAKVAEIGEDNAGVVVRIAVLHACGTLLVNGFDDSVSSEKRIETVKALIDAYFSRLTADNIKPKDD